MIVNSEFQIYTNQVILTTKNDKDFESFKEMVDSVLGWTIFQPANEKLSINIEELLFLIDELDGIEFNLDSELDSIISQINENKKFLIDESKTLHNQIPILVDGNIADGNRMVSALTNLLEEKGFLNDRLPLKNHQLRDLSAMNATPNAANFSVPGAGKTSTAIALSTLRNIDYKIIFVPNRIVATEAWIPELEIRLGEKILDNIFLLEGGVHHINQTLNTFEDRKGFAFITYSQIISEGVIDALKLFMFKNNTHLILDESHRIKGGIRKNPLNESKSGRKILEVSFYATRRDILSGTPIPQDIYDLITQMEFLYPMCGFEEQLKESDDRGAGNLISGLWTRTTKEELKESLPETIFHPTKEVPMKNYQAVFYEMVVNKYREEYLKLKNITHFEDIRKAVKRLIKLTVDPHDLAIDLSKDRDSFARKFRNSDESKILDKVEKEGVLSSKMEEVIKKATEIIKSGEQVVIWTQFVSCVEKIAKSLAEQTSLNWKEHTLYGGTDDTSLGITKKQNISNFNNPDKLNHSVLVAIAKTGGEGLSLHSNCRNAIYLDRDYNAREYLQSLDRIHRIGMDLTKEVNYFFYESAHTTYSKTIERRISANLKDKIERMSIILNDKNLTKLSLDEDEIEESGDVLTSNELSELFKSCLIDE